MTRRLIVIGLLVTLALGLLVSPLAAEAQPLTTVPRIGVLLLGSPPALLDWKERSPLLQELRRLGWREDENITVEYRWAEGHYERLPTLGAELVQARMDVLVAGSIPAGYAFQHATSTIPIVLIGMADPVATGLATSLAHPGHNITGVLSNFPELSGKWLELLKAAVPGASRIAVLSNPA